MEGIELATWALVFTTVGLLVVTAVYAVVSILSYKASKKQTQIIELLVGQLASQVTVQVELAQALREVVNALNGIRDLLGAMESALHVLSSAVRAKPYSR